MAPNPGVLDGSGFEKMSYPDSVFKIRSDPDLDFKIRSGRISDKVFLEDRIQIRVKFNRTINPC